jgi:hypothetical protein
MIEKNTRVLCPGCKIWIATTCVDIREFQDFSPDLFEWGPWVYELGEEPICYECGSEWISEDFGIYLETGWFPARH